jgi:hypothetical protein
MSVVGSLAWLRAPIDVRAEGEDGKLDQGVVAR